MTQIMIKIRVNNMAHSMIMVIKSLQMPDSIISTVDKQT